MAFSQDSLRKIFDRIEGRCHICRGKLAFCNYGKVDNHGDWEVEHSKPKLRGGTEHLNNLYAAHSSCNRSKNNGLNEEERVKHGYKNAQFSERQRQRNTCMAVGIGNLIPLLVVPQIGIPIAITSAAIGTFVGYNTEPE